jgi:hypothetical protein
MSNVTAKSTAAARWVLGAIFFVFGLNGFLHFLPQPPMAGPAADFAGALAATGYMFPLIKGTEVLASILLLSNRFVPLALTLLAPITVNILLFHIVLAPAPGLPLLIIAAQVFLAWTHREAFRGVLSAHSAPHTEPNQQHHAQVQHA